MAARRWAAAVVLHNNSSALDKTDGTSSDRHARPRADQARRAGPQKRRCRPSRGRKARRFPPAGDIGRLEVHAGGRGCGHPGGSKCLGSVRAHAGLSGEEGERLARQSGQNVEAITKFGTVLTQACQDTSREWYGLAQKQLQRNLEGLSKLAHCRSVQDFAATQSGLVRESLRYMVEDADSIVEISLRAVDEARR